MDGCLLRGQRAWRPRRWALRFRSCWGAKMPHPSRGHEERPASPEEDLETREASCPPFHPHGCRRGLMSPQVV